MCYEVFFNAYLIINSRLINIYKFIQYLFPYVKKLPQNIQEDVLNFCPLRDLPLNNPEFFKRIEVLSPEELVMFLKMNGAKGQTPLLYQKFEVIQPLLNKLSREQLLELAQVKDKMGRNPIFFLHNQNSDNYRLCYSYFEARLSKEDFNKLLLQRDNAGLFIFNEGVKNYLLQLPVEEREAFLLLETGGKNILQTNFELVKTLLDSLPKDRLFELVKRQDSSGKNLLLYHFSKANKKLPGYSCYDYLQGRLSNEQFNELLLMRDKEGRFLITPNAIAALGNLSLDQLQAFFLFRGEGEKGKNIIEMHFEDMRPLLNRLSKEQLLEIATQSSLSDPICRAYFKSKLPDVAFRDKNGMSVADYDRKLKMSPAWLEKPKMDQDLGITPKEYQERIGKVVTKAEKLWQKVKFGTEPGMVNPRGFARTPETIYEHLRIVLGKYQNKEAWLGTPPKNNPDQLHLFYSAQLSDLEQIIDYLETENDPEKIVSYFERLTLAEAQKRCAAAYRSENAQILQTLPQRPKADQAASPGISQKPAIAKAVDKAMNIGLNARLEGAAVAFYKRRFPRERPRADVHDLAQMQFYAGLTPVPDPLFHKTDSQMLIAELHKAWSLDVALEAFDGFVLNDPEEISAWLKSNVPASFESIGNQKNEIMAFENNAKAEMIQKFKDEARLITQTSSAIADAFCLPSWAGLHYEEVPDLSEKFSEAEDRSKFDKLLDQVAAGEAEMYVFNNLFAERDLLPKGKERGVFNRQLDQMVANRKLQHRIAKEFKIKDVDMIKKIMIAKGDYDKKI